MRKAAVLLVALLLVAAVVAAIVRSAADEQRADEPSGFIDKDCVDFATQAKAQRFFERKGGPAEDAHLLDPDHDGIACETRPCPCRGFDFDRPVFTRFDAYDLAERSARRSDVGNWKRCGSADG